MKLKKRKYQSVVEFALVLPIFLVFFIGIMEFGFYFWCRITIQNAVREASRTAVTYTDWSSNEAGRDADTVAIVLDRAQGMPTNVYNNLSGNITITLDPSAANVQSIKVTANVPYSSVSGLTDIVVPSSIVAQAEFRYER